MHLRRLAIEDRLGDEVVAIGPWWSTGAEGVEIDAVVLAGRESGATLVGEAKWARTVNGNQIARSLAEKAKRLPRISDGVRYAVCAREKVESDRSILTVTARDIFEAGTR